MKLEQLTYFLEAAKHEHLGRAAKTLAISTGAVSHSISALEEEFGRDLFEKRGKRIRLTEHGKLLAEKARRLLMEAENIREEISSDKLELRGHYKLAGAHVLCAKYLLPGWVQLQNGNPKLTCEIFTLRSSQVALGVIEGELDFGICFNPQSHINLASEVLHSGKLLIAVRKRHPILKIKNNTQLGAISQYPATLPKAFQGIEVCEKHPVFDKFGIHPNADCLIDSYQLAMDKIAASDSWGLLPDWLIHGDGRLAALSVPSEWEAPYFIAAVWSKNRVQSKVISNLLPILKRLIE